MLPLQAIKNYFRNLPVKRVYLFGSCSQNMQTAASDIDLLIEVDYSKVKVSLLDFIGWKLDLEKITNNKIDLVSADGISRYLQPFIDNTKVLIYEKSNG